MRYVIVSEVCGEAGDFNNNLRVDLFNKFKSRSSKLPAHFTIKAPFEYDGDIKDLEESILKVTNSYNPAKYTIKGYNYFDNRVIYMDVKMSHEGQLLHDRLIDELSKIPYIEFNKLDGKEKVFHVTLASKKIRNIFNEIWDYVNTIPCSFECEFNNVCIYKWEDNTWKLYRNFKISKNK